MFGPKMAAHILNRLVIDRWSKFFKTTPEPRRLEILKVIPGTRPEKFTQLRQDLTV